MSQLILIISSIINSCLFNNMKHPTSMGMILMMQTLLICLITNSMAQNAWFSYILFLVFLGGMLVLFIYLTSVASNELFSGKSYKAYNSYMMIIIMNMFFVLIMDSLLLPNNSEDSKYMCMESEMVMKSMFSYPYNMVTVAVILYLFLTLIAVVQITESHQGPLRSNN